MSIMSCFSSVAGDFIHWFIGFLCVLREHRECKGEAHEPCDCETWKMWLKKVAEMKPEECKCWFCLFIHHIDSKYLLRHVSQIFFFSHWVPFSLCFFTALSCSSASGWCEWSLRRCCQLSVDALQRQTLCQLQVSHTEEWGLQPHAVCKGNVA